MQRQDVGMVESRGELDLSQKPVRAERSGQIGMQDLERHEALVLAILREIHSRHAAAAELTVDRVVVRDRGAQPLECRIHSFFTSSSRLPGIWDCSAAE